MMWIDSFEAEKLKKLIGELNSEFNNPKTPDFVRRKVQERIMFLQNDILPNIQRNTMLVHSEIAKYALRCFDAAIKYDCNGLLLYIALKDDYDDMPKIGIANSKDHLPFGRPHSLFIHCPSIRIYNYDGNTKVDDIKTFEIPINESL